MFLKFCILFLLATLAATIDDDKINPSSNFQQKQNKNQKCQSGLREDNTNYIYCARQSLRLIPNLNHMDSGGGGSGSGGISGNGIYDELVLSDNLIEHIDAQTFGTTFKVKKLYLDVNPLKSIHVDSFKHLRNYLEEIYFELKTLTPTNEDDNDDMAIFDQSILRTCFNLRLLSIKGYTIHLLDGYKLARLTKLETLSITNSKLKFIDEFAFVGVENSLLELNLNSNLLDVIPTNSLERLRRLRRLNLAQNAIKHVHANAFFRVTSSLQTLDLSYNLVKRIDENAFNGPVQNSLKFLFMQNNELKWTNFVHLLYNLRWLQELNVDFNKLGIMMTMGQMKNSTHWPEFNIDSIETMPLEMSTLSMQGNSLTESTLRLFTHAYNYEQDVVASSSSSASSGKFDQASSLMTRRKKFNFAKLKKLNLARNKIRRLPERFFTASNMTQLKTLVMDRNPLETSLFSMNTFEGAHKSLTSLSMNGIDFEFESPQAIDALNLLENLQSLKLNGDGKRMERKVDSDLNLKSLVSLELQSNGFSSFPQFLCNMENLRELDLSSNRLSTFDLDCLIFKLSQRDESVYETTSLRQLNLNNNPLKCDCKMRKLKMWLMRNYDRDLLELIRWKCFEPFELNGKYLNAINLEELTCPNIEPIINTETTSIITTLSLTTSSSSSTLDPTPTTSESVLIQQQKSILIPISFSNEINKDTFNPSQHLLSTQIQIVKNPSLLSPQSSHIDLSYYSLIVGISLSISFICLLILVIFYLCCLKSESSKTASNYEYNSNASKSYLSDFLSASSKYDFKFCSPPLSSSSSSSTSSTSSSVDYSSKNSKCFLDMSSDIFQQQTLTNGGETVTSKIKNLNSGGGCFHCASGSTDTTNTTTTSLSTSMAIANPYNHLNNSIFSIQNQQQQQQLQNNDSHIYHEINTPSKVATSSSRPVHFLYENNLNYLVMPPPPPPQASILFKQNKNNHNNNMNHFTMHHQSSNIVNDFSNSLFV